MTYEEWVKYYKSFNPAEVKGYKRLTHKDDIYYIDVINDKHKIVCSPKSDNNLCVVLSAQKIVQLLNRLVELETAIESGELCELEEVRKETAKEILLLLGKGFDETARKDFKDLQWYKQFCRELELRYGVDLEDEE